MSLASSNVQPKVTVYLVSHNFGKFLEKAIESVLRQTYKSWELLLIDDNSADDTARIMELYRGDPRVRIYKTEGIGLPSVANFAVRESRGEYIIRLDGDDFFDENILLVLVQILENNPDTALAFPDYYLINEHGEIFSHERREKISESNHAVDYPPHGAATLIRKSVLQKIGGYREDLRAQDGLDLWARIKNDYRSANVNLPLFYYRRHGSNLTNNLYRVLYARQQIKRDALASQLKGFQPCIGVIPCRKNYDFQTNLWSADLNGESLLERKIRLFLKSTLFDKIVVACDSDEVLPILKKFNDPKVHFFLRAADDTFRSQPIAKTLAKVAEEHDPTFSGITVLSYIPSPFVTLESMEEAVCTLAMTNADSSIGVEEVREPVYHRTPFGLQSVKHVGVFRSDFDAVYREANIAVATKNSNLRTGSLTGPSVSHFIVAPKESFFIDSEEKLEVARIMDGK